MKTIKIKLKDKNYNIYMERDIVDRIGDYISENYNCKNIAIITDSNLENLYGERINKIIKRTGFNTKLISIKPGEKSKTLETLNEVYYELSQFKLSRNDLVIAFGGGVVGDLAGFAASTYLRGVSYIQIPTSLLAQVDSSIGGKVAVDLPSGKNLVGSFYHPNAVFIDTNLLKTLDKKFFHDGLAEIIKYGCIRDYKIIEELLSYKNHDELLDNIDSIIFKCCNIKKCLVEKDEKDLGDRMLLNFGHTIGHAIEKYFDFEQYTHGEAVAIGMAHITKKSEDINISKKGTLKTLEEVLKKYNLPYEVPKMDEKYVLSSIKLDKKVNGEDINLIVLRDIGHGIIIKVNLKNLKSYI